MEIEEIWDLILSRDPDSIQRALMQLDRQERLSIKIHLRKMTTEQGWHSEQKISAQIALNTIEA